MFPQCYITIISEEFQSQLPEAFAWIICAGFMGWNFYNTSYFPIGALLGADLRKRDTLTLRWSDGKTAELQYVGLTVSPDSRFHVTNTDLSIERLR